MLEATQLPWSGQTLASSFGKVEVWNQRQNQLKRNDDVRGQGVGSTVEANTDWEHLATGCPPTHGTVLVEWVSWHFAAQPVLFRYLMWMVTPEKAKTKGGLGNWRDISQMRRPKPGEGEGRAGAAVAHAPPPPPPAFYPLESSRCLF